MGCKKYWAQLDARTKGNFILVAVIMFVTILFTCRGFWQDKHQFIAFITALIATLVTPIIVWGVVSDWGFLTPKREQLQEKNVLILLPIGFALSGVLLFLGFTGSFFLAELVHAFEQPRHLTAIIGLLIGASKYVAMAVWCISLIYVKRISRFYIASHFVCAGLIWSGLSLSVEVSQINLTQISYSFYQNNIDVQAFPLNVGITLAVITVIILAFKKDENDYVERSGAEKASYRARRKFISQLEFRLKWNLTETETSEIIADYNEYFDLGISKGESVAQLIAEFGTPKEISRTLAIERKASPPKPIKKVLYIAVIMFATLGVTYTKLWFSAGTDSSMYYIIAATIITPIILWGIASNWKFTLPQREQKRMRSIQVFLPMLIGLSVISLLTAHILTYFVFDIVAIAMRADIITDFIYYLLRWTQYFATAAWCISLFNVSKISRFYIASHFICAGLIWSASAIFLLLFDLDLVRDNAEARLQSVLPEQLLPLIIGVVLAVVTTIVLRFNRRKSKKEGS